MISNEGRVRIEDSGVEVAGYIGSRELEIEEQDNQE